MRNLKPVFWIVGVVILGLLMMYATTVTTSKEVKKVSLLFPEKIDFAGEAVPMHIADVRERFDREMIINTNLHSTTTLVIKRANRAFPIIEPILKQYGVPEDFKYLAVIESGLVNAVSPAGARGVWQFMEQTAKERGMEVNTMVDERYHLEKSTEAACKYLLEAKKKFGNWTLAAAAYNAGMAGISRHMSNQLVEDYYDLHLTEETSRYVFRILALKEIMQNRHQYGFDFSEQLLYHPIETKKLEIDSSITDLASFAKSQGINYKVLKLHNQWLRDKKLENKQKKKYIIEIPVEGY